MLRLKAKVKIVIFAGICCLTAIIVAQAIFNNYGSKDVQNREESDVRSSSALLLDRQNVLSKHVVREPNKNDDIDYEADVGYDSLQREIDGHHRDEPDENLQLIVGDIGCIINGRQRFLCLRDNKDEIYLPFKAFLAPHFEVTGQVVRAQDGEERFEWWHSYARVQKPVKVYETSGLFGSFATYNVEHRDRVKCISATDGVPMSVQWGSTPYYYPVQIAQYALEHFSKNLTEPHQVTIELMHLEDVKHHWRHPPDFRGSEMNIVRNADGNVGDAVALEIRTDGNLENPGVFQQLDQSTLHTIELELKCSSADASFTVIFERMDDHAYYHMHYVQREDIVLNTSAHDKAIFFGMGRVVRWKRVTRNLFVDAAKGLAVLLRRKKLKLTADSIRLVSVGFRGHLLLANLRLSSAAHLAHFADAAQWFLANQDARGGWPIPVTRSFANNKLTLKPGWYSAMAQGHAMSVLARAYLTTDDTRYLESAHRALHLFNVNATQGGVLNYFLDKYAWYEEYPTTPGTFVLNGFLYSLIGLYDLKSVLSGNRRFADGAREAWKLFRQGLDSLHAMLPLYDTGSGSVYDLRHATLKGAPNIARWDYHAVHIYQLLLLNTIEPAALFAETAERWIRYANGDRAAHN